MPRRILNNAAASITRVLQYHKHGPNFVGSAWFSRVLQNRCKGLFSSAPQALGGAFGQMGRTKE